MSSPQPLDERDLATVIRLGPLVSIDLIIRDEANRVLVGLRNNEPAKDFYFVPGGRIWKNERLRDAFERILLDETNSKARYDEALLLGVYEHFYANNRIGDPSFGTHYVVVAYEIRPRDMSSIKTDPQHRELRWMDEQEILASPRVHDNTKAYFRIGHKDADSRSQ